MGNQDVTTSIQRIAMLGNHLPRQCGIATFTTDLAEAIARARPQADCFVLAVNDAGRRHAYPPRVQFEITEPDLISYRRAADYLNVNRVDVLSVQHEYGIFGGKAGSHVLTLLRELRMPIVTTLHTILEAPNDRQRRVMDELAELSSRLVVMTEQGAALLHEVHRVPLAKIDLIPHGIPSLPEGDRKEQLGVTGKSVILTFGLLSPDKGIEHVIDALPAILQEHPETVYIVLGATHPHVKEKAGEIYRLGLAARAARLGVEASVIFHDRFVSNVELTEFLSAADIYVTPYLNMEQSTSGTLAYAVGGGRAVISTPYRHAKELLADGRGILIPRADSAAIAREVISLLGDDAKRRSLGERAAAYGVDKLWPTVAGAYVASFERACDEHRQHDRKKFHAQTLVARAAELPDVNFEHLSLFDRSHRHPPARRLQRAQLRRRLLPRRQRACPAAHGTRRGQRDRRSEARTRADVAIPRVREARVRAQEPALPQLHVLRETLGRAGRLRRLPRPRDLGSRSGRGPIERSGATESRRCAIPSRRYTGTRAVEPAGVGVRVARDRGVLARVLGRQPGASGPTRAREATAGSVFSVELP
ncbi:MAG TPA: glycosyltransferase family 4 protein [Kofleriaceae bacterium]|jgi:glycosyltransferase involved in cell wall biosynthesis